MPRQLQLILIIMNYTDYSGDAVGLLKRLIEVPSLSRSEDRAADVMEGSLKEWGMACRREGNNVWVTDEAFDDGRPTLLLNAHIDTVKPVDSWTRNPFDPQVEGDRLYGLGSNDCGGGLVTLLQVFRIMAGRRRSYNMVYLASAEEEVSGASGISMVLPMLPRIDVAIVGEPTRMQPAVAEKGLMVLDVTARGKSGHAARGEGVNAIYEALDVRTNELYTNEEVYDIVRSHLKSDVTARSFRLHSSGISESHPLVRRCVELGLTPFGSPTLSDQALMPFDSLKIGPGDSARSHSADEYICLSEIEEAIDTYVRMLDGLDIGASDV